MKLMYEKNRYVADDTLAIRTWWIDEEGFLEPYGDVTVNLSAYGRKPEDDDHIYIPTYKMTSDYLGQLLDDIVDEVVGEVQIGRGRGLYAKLKPNWESNVTMMG